MSLSLRNDPGTRDKRIEGAGPCRGGRGLAEDLACPVIETTRSGRLRFINRAAAELLGLSPADRGGMLLDRLGLSAADRGRVARRLALLLEDRVTASRIWVETEGTKVGPLAWRVSARRDRRGRVIGFCALAESLPVMWALARRLKLSQQRFADFTAATPDWFWETDPEHRFTYLSERFEELIGISRASLIGCRRSELAERALSASAWKTHAADLAARRPFQDLTYELMLDGRRHLIRTTGRPVFDADGRFLGYRGSGWDATRDERAEERLRFLARHDPLTGLVNRQALGKVLEAALARAESHDGGVALFALDLEGFKRINDGYGHHVGDLLLRQVAKRLQRCVAGSDTVGRLGGNEFAVVVPLAQATRMSAIRIGTRIAERLREPFGVGGHELQCPIRLGVTLSPLQGTDAAALMQQADLALREAKRHKERFCFFGIELSAATQRRKTIEEALRTALARNEMSLVLQPQFDVSSRRLVGAEALLRWRLGQPDEIGPAVFVPIAEETRLIIEIGGWVLREACRITAGWWQHGEGPRIAVNLSPVQFWNHDLCCDVESALATTGLPARALELEITEGVLMRDTRGAAAILNYLHGLGVAIALDDFGTGYSSLSYLKRFPIHRLKIDQTFVRDLDNDEDDQQIAKAIISLGHSLGLEVVAEGVETLPHLNLLEQFGCDVAQGYFLSPPIAVSAFEAAMRDGAWRQPAPLTLGAPKERRFSNGVGGGIN